MTDQAPAMPAPTGNAYVDSTARAQHFAQLTEYFAKNPPSDPRGARVAIAAPVATPQPPAVRADRVAEFDAEMRSNGMQRSDTVPGGEVDQRALAYLTDLRRTTPADKQTTQWKAVWEADYADILAGRRMGESKQAFAARVAAAKAQAAPAATPAEGEVTSAQHSDFTAEELHGYTLPAGVEFDRDMTVALLKIARTAGVPQRFVDAYIRNN